MPFCLYDACLSLVRFLVFCFFLYCEHVYVSSFSTVFHVEDSVFMLLHLYTANIKKLVACEAQALFVPVFPKSLLKSIQLPQTFS